MLKKTAVIVMVLWSITAFAQTIVPGGIVSGVWTVINSPYMVEGEITIPAADTLSIQPGVEVIFQGHYKLIVNGWLLAVGTQTDSILFDVFNTSDGWHGIRFIDAPDSSRMEYCHITHGFASGLTGNDGSGGAIYSNSTNFILRNCLIDFNRANSTGGGIQISLQSNPSIVNNVITQNLVLTANYYGGGICIEDESAPFIYRNRISNNSALRGGGISCLSLSHATISNNLIYANTANFWGGGINLQESTNTQIINNTIAYNNAEEGGGIHFYAASPIIVNCIIWGNSVGQIFGSPTVTYSDIQGGFTGVGNIAVDPLFVDFATGDYHLQSMEASYHNGMWLPDAGHSPCVDSGDMVSLFANETWPNGGRINMGAYGNTDEASRSYNMGYPWLAIDLTYLSGSPVGIGGGNVFFGVFMQNQDNVSLNFDAWIDISYEGGVPFTPILRPFQNFYVGATVNRTNMYFPVNAGYPAGNYEMAARVGVFPDTIWAESSFPFVKTGSSDGKAFVPYWPDVSFPDPFGDNPSAIASTVVPQEFSLSSYPNPFNPITVASFELRVSSFVSLSVYDISGRKVADLVNGWRDAGIHEVTFDAVELPTGIYFARIEAGEFQAVEKMVLIK